jgi:hypothetical protein
MIILILLIIIICLIFILVQIKSDTVQSLAERESSYYNPRIKPDGDSIIEITIKNGVPEVTAPAVRWVDRQHYVINFIKNVMERYNSNINCKLIIGMDDEYPPEGMGICVFSKFNRDQRDTMMPDLYSMFNYMGSLDYKDSYKPSDKINKAIFAGSSTGSLDPSNNERILFSNWSLDVDNVDSYITKIVQMDEVKVASEFPRYKQFTTTNIPKEDQFKYRYIISFDGNTTAWDRVPWIMNSHSVLLKKKSDKLSWYYNFLNENEHYLSFDRNEDIIDLVKNTTPTKHAELVKNANQFVKDYLGPESHMYYMYRVIQNVARKQN